MSRSRRHQLLTAALTVMAVCATAGSASAASLASAADSCSTQVYTQPFLRYGDPLTYVLVPSGAVEGALSGWTTSGGAAAVAGNESAYVHATSDRSSLQLPAGSTVTTRPICVGLGHPTLRIFARNTGSPLSLLKVEAIFDAPLAGSRVIVPIGLLAGDSTWQPTLPMLIDGNLVAPTMPGGFGAVAFRLTPVGAAGQWRVDDLYVDPRRTN